MSKKKTYVEISEMFDGTGCTLLMTEDEYNSNYKNGNCYCPYQAACGHKELERTYYFVRRALMEVKRYNCLLCYRKSCMTSVVRGAAKSKWDALYEKNNRINQNGHEKKCCNCNIWKQVHGYHKDQRTKDGYGTCCKECYKKMNKDRMNNLVGDDFVKKLLQGCKSSHKTREGRGVIYSEDEPLNYELEDVNNHKVDGEFIDVNTGKVLRACVCDHKEQLSLDRKSQKRTYYKDKSGKTTEDNCQTTSVRINMMKMDLTDDEFLETIKEIGIYRLGMKLPNE